MAAIERVELLTFRLAGAVAPAEREALRYRPVRLATGDETVTNGYDHGRRVVLAYDAGANADKTAANAAAVVGILWDVLDKQTANAEDTSVSVAMLNPASVLLVRSDGLIDAPDVLVPGPEGAAARAVATHRGFGRALEDSMQAGALIPFLPLP